MCDIESSYDTDYGIFYGPDPKSLGQSTLDMDGSDGMDRVLQFNETSTGGGHYASAFSNELWVTYLQDKMTMKSKQLC